MAFDVNNNYRGDFYGKDRLGFTTPDVDASPWERPFLTIPYPAPWLPGKRRDDAHPVGAQVVLSTGNLVGVDKSGALVPAGMVCGETAGGQGHTSGGGYCLVVYGQDDVGFAINPKTGNKVQAAGEYVVIAAPSDGANLDVVTLANGQAITVTGTDVTFGQTCTLIPGGYSRPLGYAIRNVWQYLGGV